MTPAERLPIPQSYADEAAEMALVARLKEIAGSPTAHLVQVTYWRDGYEMPLAQLLVPSHTAFIAKRRYPLGATHLTIETAAAGG